MLKNKKAIYILIPLNIFIWGYFAYRIFGMFSGEDSPILSEKIDSVKYIDLKDSITYKLNLDYKDPFLRESDKQNKHYSEGYSNNPAQQKVKVVKTPSVTIPAKPPLDIKYFGLVKNSTSGTATALVALNGQSKLIKVNDILEGVTFKSFNKDSLVARVGKEQIIVRK